MTKQATTSVPMFRGIREKYEGFRRKYSDVHGKVVDFITHPVEDGPLYFRVGFAGKTDFPSDTPAKCSSLGLTFLASRPVISK